MKQKRSTEELLSESLGLFKRPPTEQMNAAGDRVRALIQSEGDGYRDQPALDFASISARRKSSRLLFASALAAAVLVVVAGSGLWQKRETGFTQISINDIESRRVFHSKGREGSTLRLPDNSRVEMRVGTELSFDRAADGLRILLKDGSILVSAAKQRAGHLYVQTKDVTVSVVGTVFLVKAEQQGSRVAVIEGEVRVKEGASAMTERLLPGEQVATSSVMAARPLVEEIAWSRHAPEHFAMLQQSAIPPATATPEAPDKFEVASIRPSGGVPAGPGARGGGQRVPSELPCPTANAFEMTRFTQLDPGRLVFRRKTLYALIAIAYGHSCPAPDTMTGGLDWMKAEDFDVEAKIPAEAPSYTKEQMYSGNAPQLQRMIQNLLAERFKLVLKRDVKEVQGYNLVVAQQGKVKLSADQSPDQGPAPRGGGLRNVIGIPSLMAPISRLVSMLQRSMERPIADKTGLTGLYDIWLEFPEIPMPGPPADDRPIAEIEERMEQINRAVRDLLPAKLETQTGLKLEPAKVPVQVLEIVSAERPSEN
jgi:uncharacterized protein (TIGR03435 family)